MIEAFGVEAGLGTEDRLNDGVLEGDPDVALLEREIRIGIGAKRDTPPGRWKVIPTTVGGLIVTLTVHEVGDKDGTCFLQGECLDGKRHAKAMKAMYALVLDLDTGISAEEIDERVRAAGLLCLRYSTHSHMKDTTKIRDGAFLEWGKRQGKEWAATTDVKRAPELDDLRLYLLNEKGYRPHILRDLEFVQFGQDGDGGHILVRHAPIPKYRLVFILDKPYVFAEQGYQNHAIERWKRKYAGFAHGLGVWFDRSCVDPSRLFYRPRHAEGSPFEIRLIAGKPVILDDVPEVDYNRGSRPGDDSPFAVAAAELLGDAAGRTDYKEPRLRRWAALYADYFDVTALLEAREQKAEERERGGIYAYCPNRHAHTDEAAIQGCYANDPGQEGSGTGFTFRCTHDHCRDLDRLGLLDMLLEQKVIAWADLIDPDFSYGMPDDVRAKAEAALRGEESRPAPAATPSELQQRVAAVAKFDEPAIAEVCAAIVAADLSAVDRTDLLKALQEQSGHNSKQFGAIKSKVAKDAKPPKPSTEEVDTTIMSDKNMVTRLQEYNEKYALVMLGSDARIMVRPETAGTLPEFLRVDSWKLMTKPDKVYIDVGGEIKRVSVTQYWLEWDERKVYNGSVCFEPDPDFSNPHVFNLWGGWPIQPKPGDWSLLRDHIFTVICRRKPERVSRN